MKQGKQKKEGRKREMTVAPKTSKGVRSALRVTWWKTFESMVVKSLGGA